VSFEASHLFSNAAKRMRRSEIRELLKLTQKPDIISFAGGLPAPDLFPVEDFKKIAVDVLDKQGSKVLQYGTTEGDPGLINELIAFEGREGTKIASEHLLVSTASQQGLDLVGKALVNEGDPVIMELPSYLGGLQAFGSYGADMIGVPQDFDGIRVDILEEKLNELAKAGRQAKFIYIVPDFQNPSGVTATLERRKKVLELARKFETFVVEDTPYRELRFEGESVAPIITMDEDDRVITLHTFSKILAPGFRIGWMITKNKSLMEKFVMGKQATDLCTAPAGQIMIAEYMSRGLLEKQIERIRAAYLRKRDIMLEVFDAEMPKLEGLKWTHPQGGLFLWVCLPEHMSAVELFPKAIEKKVAYVVGTAFHCDGKGQNCMRINFSYASEEQIKEGARRLASLIKEEAK
jgi:2-aminoadipate transaminase